MSPRIGDKVGYAPAGGTARVIAVDPVGRRADLSSRIFAGWVSFDDLTTLRRVAGAIDPDCWEAACA